MSGDMTDPALWILLFALVFGGFIGLIYWAATDRPSPYKLKQKQKLREEHKERRRRR